MADNQISSLPVMRDKSLVGMITETDIFHIMLEMMGGRIPGVRLTAEVVDQPGKLYEIAGVIHKLGGDVLGLAAILGSRAETRIVTIKVVGIDLDTLKKAIAPVVEQVLDIRETKIE